jgi:primary-amine oxidase
MNKLGMALVSTMFAALFLLPAAPAQAQGCTGIYRIEQPFPTVGVEQTRWLICWQIQRKHALVITGAFFRKSPTSPWVRVLWDARVAEIFVPYHDNSNRFYDVTGFNWDWVRLTANECKGGTRIGPNGNDVCKTVRDRGLAWMDYQKARRGEELVLWGAIAAANYNYITEFSFRDDGVIEGRVGSTAQKFNQVTHTHDVTWRLDIDLNGWANDFVDFGTHTEVGANGVDTMPNIAQEAGKVWDPQSFHMFHIRDANLKNGKGHTSGYHLMPTRLGNARHQEAYSQKDMWVTLYHGTEWSPRKLPTTYVNGENVNNADIVVWYTSAAHHMVRDEDSDETHVMWVSFMLKPFDFFDKTPLFP